MYVDAQQSISCRLLEAIGDRTHVIWDWNGTLLSDVDNAVRTVNSLLTEHSLPEIDAEQYRAMFEFPVINYYRALGFNFERQSFEDLCHHFVDRFMQGVPALEIFPVSRRALHINQQAGKTQSVLSATDQQNLDWMVEHFKLGGYFQHVYGIDNKLAASKVARGHELIAASGIDPRKTVMIGDTLHDLEVAQTLGIDAILVSHGHQCPTRLKSHHGVVIEFA